MNLVYSHPQAVDGSKMWELVKENNDLDLNSSYSYFLVSKLHSQRCIIVTDKTTNKLVGFIMGFVFSEEPKTYFVWQITVSKNYRCKNIGSSLIEKILSTNEDVRFIKGTMSKDNSYYHKLLKKIALKYNTWYSIKEGFEQDQFPEGHENEQLVTVGPIDV